MDIGKMAELVEREVKKRRETESIRRFVHGVGVDGDERPAIVIP